ncbi:MAG: chlorophyllase/cutinase-like alpha/beta fold protein [Polyangiaceae bacterium]
MASRVWIFAGAFLVACEASPDGATSGSPSAAIADAGALVSDAAASIDDAGVSADAEHDASTSFPYDVDGPIAFATSEASVTNGSDSFIEHVYMPSSAGLHPLVSLSPGLLQNAIAYAPYAERLASYGIAVILRDDPGALTNTTDVAADVAFAIETWAPIALQNKVDFDRVGLAGHSRGGKATLLAAEGALAGKVVAWFGLDPVDSSALSGGVQARDSLGALGIPTTYLAASIASSCSPAADTADVLYAATPSPSVEITGIGAGHTQLQDPSDCNECSLCAPQGTADSAAVLAYAVRYLTAFFARELLGATDVGAAFEKAGAGTDVAKGLVRIDVK